MGALSVWKVLIIATVVLMLFGRGRIAETMGDFGKGIRSFKKGMDDDVTPAGELPKPDAKVAEAERATRERAS